MKDRSDYLTPAEIHQLLDGFRDHFRNYLITRILIVTGMRISELLGSPPNEYNLPGLQAEDIDFDERILTFIGKGKKVGQVLMDKETLGLLRRFIEANHITAGRVFQLRRQTYGDILKRKAKSLGLTTRKMKDGLPHPHSLRHSWGPASARATGDPRVTKVALRHESIQTTDDYYDIRSEFAREGFDKTVSRLLSRPREPSDSEK